MALPAVDRDGCARLGNARAAWPASSSLPRLCFPLTRCELDFLLATMGQPPLKNPLSACQCRKDTSWLTKITEKPPGKSGPRTEDVRIGGKVRKTQAFVSAGFVRLRRICTVSDGREEGAVGEPRRNSVGQTFLSAVLADTSRADMNVCPTEALTKVGSIPPRRGRCCEAPRRARPPDACSACRAVR